VFIVSAVTPNRIYFSPRRGLRLQLGPDVLRDLLQTQLTLDEAPGGRGSVSVDYRVNDKAWGGRGPDVYGERDPPGGVQVAAGADTCETGEPLRGIAVAEEHKQFLKAI
jgi:hypothetical protein